MQLPTNLPTTLVVYGWLQVEGSVIKGGLRIIGITLGSLIAYALGLSGSAMNSPFYVAGMIALLIAIISLPYPIAELRCVGCGAAGMSSLAAPHEDRQVSCAGGNMALPCPF